MVQDKLMKSYQEGRDLNQEEINKEYEKVILNFLLLDAQSYAGVIEGLEGKGYERVFRSALNMTDEEVALNISFLIATVGAAELGNRLGRSFEPEKLKNDPKFKKVFKGETPRNFEELVSAQKKLYEKLNKRDIATLEYRATLDYVDKLRKEKEYNREKGNRQEVEKLQQEIDLFLKDELLPKRNEFTKEERNYKEEERIRREKREEERLDNLGKKVNDVLTREDYFEIYRIRFNKNPSRGELTNFITLEREKIAEGGVPPDIINEWYSEFGTNKEGVSIDLQQLARNVLNDLDTNNNGILESNEIPNIVGQYFYDNYSGLELRAISEAYNNKAIWESLKKDYKAYIAASTAVAGAVAVAETGGGSGEIVIDEDIDESIDEEEEDIELVEDIEEEEPEPEEEEPTIDPQDNKPKIDIVNDADIPRKPSKISRSFSELLLITARLSSDIYEETKGNEPDSRNFFIFRDYLTPFSIKKIRGKIFVTIRGSVTVANWLTNITLQSPILGADRLGYYRYFRERINERNEVRFHTGFLEDLHLPNKATRLGQVPIDGRTFTPMYSKIRQMIDLLNNGVDEVIFCGHSLGGALAGILYYLYNLDLHRQDLKIKNVRAISFGAPRFVKKGYENAYNDMCPNYFRCWNEKDIVPYTPLVNSVISVNILSGYIHVGRNLCLNNPRITSNNINRYLTDIIKDNKPAKIAMRGATLETGRKMRSLLKQKAYQASLLGSTLTALTNKELKLPYKDLVYDSMEMNLKPIVESVEGWRFKCAVLGDCGFQDYLRGTDLGEDPRQQDFTILSIFGGVCRGMLGSLQHSRYEYIKNVEKIIEKEIDRQEPILNQVPEITIEEKEKNIPYSKVSEEEVEKKLDIDLNSMVLGFTEKEIIENEIMIIEIP